MDYSRASSESAAAAHVVNLRDRYSEVIYDNFYLFYELFNRESVDVGRAYMFDFWNNHIGPKFPSRISVDRFLA